MAVSMTRAVTVALRSVRDRPADTAAAALCRQYARLIDDATDDTRQQVVSDLGPKLLAALTALGLTLAGRKADRRTADGTEQRSPLDELRERRQQRRTG